MDVPLTADELRGVALPVRRWGAGYAVDEVDALLERVASALQQPGTSSLSAAAVTRATFTVVRRRGYDQECVDDLLDRAVDALRNQGPAAAPPATAPPPTAPPPTAAELGVVDLPPAPFLSVGYVREDVDALLRRATSALRHGGTSGPGLTADDVRTSRFRTARRGGYSLQEVDELLDQVARALADGPRR